MRNQLSSVDIPDLLGIQVHTWVEISFPAIPTEDLAFDEYIVIELKFGRKTILHCIISLSCFQASPFSI